MQIGLHFCIKLKMSYEGFQHANWFIRVAKTCKLVDLAYNSIICKLVY